MNPGFHSCWAVAGRGVAEAACYYQDASIENEIIGVRS